MSHEQVLFDRPSFPAQLDYSHPLTKGLIGCWIMNETSGMRMFDSSPYGNHGVVLGPKLVWQGKLFNSNYITVVNNGRLNLQGDFTIVAWLYLNTLNANIIKCVTSEDWATASADDWLFDIGGDGKIYFYIKGAGNTGSTTVVSANTLLNVSTIRKSGVITTYLRDQVASGTFSTSNVLGNGQVLEIGRAQVSLDGGISGFCNMILMYNRALNTDGLKRLNTNPYEMFLK